MLFPLALGGSRAVEETRNGLKLRALGWLALGPIKFSFTTN